MQETRAQKSSRARNCELCRQRKNNVNANFPRDVYSDGEDYLRRWDTTKAKGPEEFKEIINGKWDSIQKGTYRWPIKLNLNPFNIGMPELSGIDEAAVSRFIDEKTEVRIMYVHRVADVPGQR
eukprot:702941-Pelagomonas_calceolata.AAC.1